MKNVAKLILTTLMLTLFITSYELKAAIDDYPEFLKLAPQGSMSDDNSFSNGHCTSFVAYRLNTYNEFPFHNLYAGVRWSHAKYWARKASNLGFKVDKNPAIGSVAYWTYEPYGHVGWVADVDGDNVLIEEYNYYKTGEYDVRWVHVSNVEGFIHFKDISRNHYIDLNWVIDGVKTDINIDNITVDVYINGKLKAQRVSDYYESWPMGTTYEFKNIIIKNGYQYDGVCSGTLKGTVEYKDVETRLSFSKKKNNKTWSIPVIHK